MSGPVSRKGLLASAAASAAAAAVGCGGEDEEQREREARTAADLEIVRFLLRVERVAGALWADVVARDALRELEASDLARSVAANDRTHAETLERYERRMGRNPSEVPATDFEPVFAAGPREVLRTGAELANLAAAAYLGQLNRIQDRTMLGSVLAIHSVEGRQAAALNRGARRSGEVLPDGAFAEPLTMAQVRSRLRRYVA